MLHLILPTHRASAALDLFSSDNERRTRGHLGAYQNIIDAYRSSNARGGKTILTRLTSKRAPSLPTWLFHAR